MSLLNDAQGLLLTTAGVTTLANFHAWRGNWQLAWFTLATLATICIAAIASCIVAN